MQGRSHTIPSTQIVCAAWYSHKLLYPGVSGSRNRSCDINTTDVTGRKKTQYILILTEHNESVWTLYTALGPEDRLKYRNSSRSSGIINPVVLRSFQRLDYKHSLQTVGEVVTLSHEQF